MTKLKRNLAEETREYGFSYTAYGIVAYSMFGVAGLAYLLSLVL